MSDVSLETILSNDKVDVTKVTTPAGWVGTHTHPGNQLAIVLSPVTMTYKEGGKEYSKDYKPGDVVWVDHVTHDHTTNIERTYLLLTLK